MKRAAHVAPPILRWLGHLEYQPAWRAMQAFTDARDAQTRDEIWFLEHPAVYTLGLNAAPQHVLTPGLIPLVQIDRGGQVTYHGPGQLLIYPLLNVRRLELGVRELVVGLENAAIATLSGLGIQAEGRREAPGIYVDGRKIASIGLRIRRGCSYHGMAFNIAMDLQPFKGINPCGYRGLEVIDLRCLGVQASLPQIAERLAPQLLAALGWARVVEWAPADMPGPLPLEPRGQ